MLLIIHNLSKRKKTSVAEEREETHECISRFMYFGMSIYFFEYSFFRILYTSFFLPF
jgi:hypothetical protein